MATQNPVLAWALRPRGPVRAGVVRRGEQDFTVLEVTGELDILTAGTLGMEIDREVREGDGDLVIDLRKTEFVDSAGLHILLNAQRRLTRQSRTLSVVCVSGPVRHVFEVAKLLETLGVIDSVRDHRRRAGTTRATALRRGAPATTPRRPNGRAGARPAVQPAR